MPKLWRAYEGWVFALALSAGFVHSPRASAQTRYMTADARTGSGVSLGTGQGGAVTARRTPLFVDAGIRTWTDETPDPIYGASLRLELDGRVGVGVVPHVELSRSIGPFEIRPRIGAPLFFAPYSLLGLELGATLAIPLVHRFALTAGVFAAAFFWGSDLPGNSALTMINATVGAELAL